MSFYMPMFIIGGVAVVLAPLVLFVAPAIWRKIQARREYKRRHDKRY